MDFQGFIIAIIICAVLAVPIIILAKKERKKKQAVLSAMSQEITDQLTKSKFYISETNANFLLGMCYIYKIAQINGGVEVNMVYYYKPDSEDKKADSFHFDQLYINQNDFDKCEYIKEGTIVSTMHNRFGLPLKVCKILSKSS